MYTLLLSDETTVVLSTFEITAIEITDSEFTCVTTGIGNIPIVNIRHNSLLILGIELPSIIDANTIQSLIDIVHDPTLMNTLRHFPPGESLVGEHVFRTE